MKTLLHICCAPCANQCIDSLRSEGIDLTGLWYNPNIHPFTEYRARRNCLQEYAKTIELPLLMRDDYSLRPFVREVAGDIAGRCVKCYEMRLFEAARAAKEGGFDAFTSSLFISPYQKHELMRDVAYRAAEEYGVELKVLTSPREIDIDKQIELIRQVTADKPDVMILSAADYDRCAEATEEAIAAGIGVVAIDTDVNAAGRACFVGSNSYEIGLEMGRAMASYLPEGGKVAVIQHMLTTTTGIERTRGVLDALNEAGNIEILGSFCCDNSTEQAQTITTELLSADPEIRGFVCTNEVCNVGAANALVELGMGGRVYVVGCDNSQRQIQFLEQNIIQAIVTQRPFNMGYMAVQQAVRVANGEQTDDFVEVSCVLITRENMYTQENQKLLFPVLR